IYRGIGSIDFVAAARSILFVGEDPDKPNHRAFVHCKSNLAPKGQSVGYAIEDGKFFWTGPSSLTYEQMENSGSEHSRTEAEKFLMMLLASGPMLTREIARKAAERGITPITLRRARERLEIQISRGGYQAPSTWALPDTEQMTLDEARAEAAKCHAGVTSGSTLDQE